MEQNNADKTDAIPQKQAIEIPEIPLKHFEARQELESLWLDGGKTIDDISNEHYKRCIFVRDDIICVCNYL